MAWQPIKLFYQHSLAAASLKASSEHADYPASNLLERVDGTLYKAASSALTVIDLLYDMGEDTEAAVDYLLMHNHNLFTCNGSLTLTSYAAIDTFDDSAFDTTQFGSLVSGGGTVAETTELTMTGTVITDAACIYEKNGIVKENVTDRIKFRVTSVGAAQQTLITAIFENAAAPTLGTGGSQTAKTVYRTWMDTSGNIVFSYRNGSGTQYYWKGSTSEWTTNSSDVAYAGSTGTTYWIYVYRSATAFAFVLYDSALSTLTTTDPVLWANAWDEWSTDTLWVVVGDHSTDSRYGVLVVNVLEVAKSAQINSDVPTSDATYMREFTSRSARFWNVHFAKDAGADFFAAMLYFGTATELDYADQISPYDDDLKSNVNVGGTGFVQGIHDKYTERQVDIRFDDAEDALIAKIEAWKDAVGLGLSGIQWEPGEHASDVWMMRRKDGKWRSPFTKGGLYRNATMSLIGRKEI